MTKPAQVRDAGAIALLLAAVVLVGLGFAWPWLPEPPVSGAALERYAPLRDGESHLIARYDAGGRLAGWASQTTSLVPGVRAIASALRPTHSLALLSRYSAHDESDAGIDRTLARLAGARIVEIQERAVQVDGVVTAASRTVARETGGEYLVALYDSTSDADVVFDPPLLTLPADLGSGKHWSSEGQVNAVLHYQSTGRVVDAGPRETAVGKMEDCLAVETRLAISNDTQTFETVTTDWLCAGVGHVATQEVDSGGAVVMRYEVVSVPDRPADPALLPPALASQPQPPQPDARLADWRTWQLSRFAGVALTGGEIESSIAPAWIPSDPPAVLMAAYNSDLLAFDPSSTISGTLWRFHTAGTIYGPPAYDAARGRLYFGATDKRLRALDARGLFLWSFKTGDSVATRPVIASAGDRGGTVVFGSEDRRVYGVDADTGRLRWSFAADAAVVSSPALFGQGPDQLAIFGCDDANVYALKAWSGELVWTYGADASVEAPIVVDGGVAYVAVRTGALLALDAATGEARWSATIGGSLRTAPAVGPGVVGVVDGYGNLAAVDRAGGQVLWRDAAQSYVGPPLALGETLLVAAGDGRLYLFGADGRRLSQWDAGALSSPDERFDFFAGPTSGGGALWAASAKPIVWRLGPEAAR